MRKIFSSAKLKTGTEIERPRSKHVVYFDIGYIIPVNSMNQLIESKAYSIRIQFGFEWIVPHNEFFQTLPLMVSGNPHAPLVVLGDLHQEHLVVEHNECVFAQDELLGEERAQVVPALVDDQPRGGPAACAASRGSA